MRDCIGHNIRDGNEPCEKMDIGALAAGRQKLLCPFFHRAKPATESPNGLEAGMADYRIRQPARAYSRHGGLPVQLRKKELTDCLYKSFNYGGYFFLCRNRQHMPVVPE